MSVFVCLNPLIKPYTQCPPYRVADTSNKPVDMREIEIKNDTITKNSLKY